MLLEKANASSLKYDIQLPDSIDAPVARGDMLGKIVVTSNGSFLYEIPLVSEDDIERMGTFRVFASLFRIFVGKN